MFSEAEIFSNRKISKVKSSSTTKKVSVKYSALSTNTDYLVESEVISRMSSTESF